MPHSNNKQDKNRSPIFNRQEYHLIQPYQSEGKTNKQTNKQQKNSTNLTLYKAYTNQWTNIRRAETKRRKEFNLEAWKKETSNITSLKKIMKKKYYTSEGTN